MCRRDRPLARFGVGNILHLLRGNIKLLCKDSTVALRLICLLYTSLDYIREHHGEIITELEETKTLTDELRQAVLTAAEEYKGR